MGPSHQLPIKSKREILFFLLYGFWGPGRDLLGDPSHSGTCRWAPGKTGKSPQTVRILPGSALHTSVVLGQQRRQWCDLVPSSPHSEWQASLCYELELWIRTWNLFPVTPGCRSFLSCAVILLYCWSHLVSTELGLSAARLGTPEYGQIEMWIALSLPDYCRQLSGTWLFEYLEWLWIIRW